jgi:hypothetical protein
MKFMRQTTKCMYKGYKRNQDSLDEVKIESALTTILSYTKNGFAVLTAFKETDSQN